MKKTRPQTIAELDTAVSACRACPRLVRWREQVAQDKRAAFADQNYWGKAVPGFGLSDAAMLIVGLAPAAHGANRTGRMFTGDRSGDVLYRAMHAVGLANQPTATHLGDGLTLNGVRITAPVHCAPPQNKPTPAERDRCKPWLDDELRLLRPTLRSILVLGAFGWQSLLPILAANGWDIPRPAPKFGHGVRLESGSITVFASYHVSQRNTFTGLLTPRMIEDVLRDAGRHARLL
ncbi:uracil-DNA glycosylase [Rhodococcus sp. KRD162]|uniref:uracil-DNA glycosylase n=1 Tax=Rhodococcus sp. KRD162 TaxID=2729725 RepID=UPI0019D0B495|nr:uracil-DNA glycosylase [Rhodococcus sp. KRD162]